MLAGAMLRVSASVTVAQGFFLTLSNTPNPIVLGETITYQLSVSNTTGNNLAPNQGVIRSSWFPTNALLLSATVSQGTLFTSQPGLVAFTNITFTNTTVVLMELVLRPVATGSLANRLTASEINTPAVETHAVSEVIPRDADLGVAILLSSNGVFPGDRFSYRLLATNAGPQGAANVVVSNPFPAGVSLVGLSPSNQVSLTNGLILFSLTTLSNRESATATVSVLATQSAPTGQITATISAPIITDTNPVNNTATRDAPILTPVPGEVAVVNVGTQQVLNPQTGWLEQRVALENVTNAPVESVRLLVNGLTHTLANATGTNGQTPYLAHGGALEPGDRVELILELDNPSRVPGLHTNFTAYATPTLDLPPSEGTGIPVDRIVFINRTNLTFNNGRVLLEWPATNAAAYQVLYDGQADFGAARGSLPLVVAPAGANRVQWLDYGPPRTLSAPTDAASTSRFYKVIQLP